MKKSVLAIISLFAFNVIAQEKTEIDTRLQVDKQLATKAEEHFKNNPTEYNYLIFELDHGYFIKSINELTENQKNQLLPIEGIVSASGEAFDVSVLSDPKTFNLFNYNFQRSETKTIGYDLGNGNVLVFYSGEKLRAMYSQTTSNK